MMECLPDASGKLWSSDGRLTSWPLTFILDPNLTSVGIGLRLCTKRKCGATMASSSTSGDGYSFSIDCPVCGKVVTFSCTREKVRGASPSCYINCSSRNSRVQENLTQGKKISIQSPETTEGLNADR
jgi:hypothetical protein